MTYVLTEVGQTNLSEDMQVQNFIFETYKDAVDALHVLVKYHQNHNQDEEGTEFIKKENKDTFNEKEVSICYGHHIKSYITLFIEEAGEISFFNEIDKKTNGVE